MKRYIFLSLLLSVAILGNAELYQVEVRGCNGRGVETGHEWVDLGLSVKWATCNIGAVTPERNGNYYSWGETRTKTNYAWSTYLLSNGTNTTLTKYCTQIGRGYNGFVDNKTSLELADDAAHVNWGGKWRMPTPEEYKELKDSCTWTWTTKNGDKGYEVTSKKNGNSIFLPAAGYHYDNVREVGTYGIYWSKSLIDDDPENALALFFNSVAVDTKIKDRNRYDGLPVRAVCQ